MRLPSRFMSLIRFLRPLSELLFPSLCAGCLHPLTESEEELCLHCNWALPRTGYHHLPDNETSLRLAGRFRFEQASSFLYFAKDGLTQSLLHQIKYDGRKDLATYLGLLFARELHATAWLDSIDAVLPVPLHPKKEAKRGFNQSALVAKALATAANKELLNGTLIRRHFTETQTLKSRAERLDNLKDAFSMTSSAAAQNKHVLLVDDVLTTGATIEACATALATVPGMRLSVATLAIAHQ